MRQITELKICEECKGACQLIQCPTRPMSSEWYCEKCHRSYPVYEQGEAPPAQPQSSAPRPAGRRRS